MWDIFLISLVPNFLRQLVYLKASKKSKKDKFGFCVSPETRWMKEKGYLPYLGFLEEIGWGILWTIFWALGIKVFMYGWVSDALFDCIIATLWTYNIRLKNLHYKEKYAFILREIIIPYVLLGPLVYILGTSFINYSVVISVFSILLWIII